MVRAMRSIRLNVADDDDDNNVDDFAPLGMGSKEDDEGQLLLLLLLLLLQLLLSRSPDLNFLECFSPEATEDTLTDASCPSLPSLELLGPTRSST